MKRIKGHYIKEGKNLEKGKLYIIRKNRIVVFEEEETDDIVNIHFNITKEQQYGIYSSEFKPSFIEDKELTAFADLGVVVGIDMNKKRSKEEVDHLEMYMSHLVGVLRDTEE